MVELFFEKTKKDENTIILVEGESDIAFLSLLLIKWKKYKYASDLPINGIHHGMKCSKYVKNNSYVYILSVGGFDRFTEGFESIKSLITNYKTKTLVVITDNDINNEDETLSKMSFGIPLKANVWFKANVVDDYGENKNLDIYVKTIPKDKIGTLENVLIDALKDEEPDITNSSIRYIDNLNDKESKYLKKERMKLKAKTGVIFNLISPDRTFDTLQKKFELINLDDENIVDNFNFLKSKL